MKHIWRIIRFTGSLWRYYVAISVFTILVSLMTQLTPLLTKGVIDEITKSVGGGEAASLEEGERLTHVRRAHRPRRRLLTHHRPS